MSVSKFTPEVRGALLERFSAGVSLRDACRAIDLREATAKGWIQRGRAESGTDYAEFAEKVTEARAQAASRPEAMDADELAQVVSMMARKGSVQAAKLRWDMLNKPEAEEVDHDDDLAEVDDLARRRRG